ncbi:hypothetical protein ADK75_06380 [Streptomyces virginiae]|uniref:Uncharacterized protein n=1 Tax=Streptomyces virginiae TaxID=1961 RepID=A0A0L8N2P0_STRVG|nr:hypothetical protein [Streptomyces virginiae]KOG56853.1 hypothetical protein ADK75_06380 [Streptomyces virginiae]
MLEALIRPVIFSDVSPAAETMPSVEIEEWEKALAGELGIVRSDFGGRTYSWTGKSKEDVDDFDAVV